MPRRRPKARKGNDKSSRDRLSLSGYLYEADIRITDFADNPAAKLPTRIRKKASKLQYNKMQLLPELSTHTQPQGMRKLVMEEEESGEMKGKSDQRDDDNDLNWDEKDWDDDFDYDLEGGTEGSNLHLDDSFDEQEEEGNTKKAVHRRGSKKKRSAQTTVDEGVVYPSDLWFVLANYIQPTDIGTFATLCRDAHWATRTATFWRKLYHRCVNQSVQLPSYLRPSSVKRVAGLRATVIKALYHTHEPYKTALNNLSPVGDGKYSPEAATNYTCLYTWWSRGRLGGHFTHFLKMRDCAKPCKIPAGTMGHSQPALHENPDGRDCIMRIHCASFQDVPLARIMGLQLVRSSVCVGADMRYHRLKLVFGRLDRRGTGVPSSLVTVSLDPVIRMEVLHWWHPQFSESSRPSVDRAITDNLVNAREDRFWEGL
ncbi:transmembrane protein 183-like [Diadema antillarum]|uniref:transmembrane protein 183-like n=1 Tax=Diadema antillarum TaxID=105358 RepID=UPI003A86A260